MNRIKIKDTLFLLLLGLQTGASGVLAEPSASDMRDRLQACANCHTQTDQSPGPADIYYPSIDGKPVEYLYQQLLNFRDGRRNYPLMQQMLAYLSDDYLHEIASYYSQLPSRQVPAASAPDARAVTTSERARLLVEQADGDRPACTACHGESLQGDGVAIPGLRGLGAIYITAQLGAWQAGTRRAREPDCMADIANALDGADIAAIAQWVANTPHEPSPVVASAPRELPIACGAVQ